MNVRSPLIALGLLLGLAACVPGAAEYTESEAPKALQLSNASASFAVRFYPGSARLLPTDAARLDALARNGEIAPTDRVTVSPAGGPGLAAARFQSISGRLVPYRLVPSLLPLASVPPNRALIESGRYLVTLPPCPNWSKSPSAADYTNTDPSNFGCADAVNLGRMVWHPADLAEGVPLGPQYVEATTPAYAPTVFTAGAATPTGGVFNATPQSIANAVNVVGCANTLAPSVSTSATGTAGGGGSSQSLATAPSVGCTNPPAPA